MLDILSYTENNGALLNAGASLFFASLLWILLRRSMTHHPQGPPLAKSTYPIIGAPDFILQTWTFFQRERNRVLKSSKAKNPFQAFSFKLGKLPIIGLTGEKGRKFLFTESKMNFEMGYEYLFGGTPDPSTEVMNTDERTLNGQKFIIRLKPLLNSTWLQKGLAQMVDDSIEAMAELGPEGQTDPWVSIYRLVYRLTVRTVGCKELAESPELLAESLRYYQEVEQGTQPSAMLAPKWLNTPSKKRKEEASTKLYLLIKGIVDKRNAEGRREDDPLQTLIDRDDDMPTIVRFIMGALLAGQLNSGINAAYMLAYLAAKPEWREKARTEVDTILNKYAGPDGTLSERAKKVPLHGWEEGCQSISLTLKETIRLNLRGSVPRLYSGPDFHAGDYIIPQNTFVTYPINDAHLNPEIYKDPELFDPERYLPGREEDKKEDLAWVGWGTGKHPCAGMRFAKLEMNVIVFLFLAAFDWDAVNEKGRKLGVQDLAASGLNNPAASRPTKTVLLKYQRRHTLV